ncbi:MAG: hypothetical protein CHACPFDD_01687 [Phycisphaerae bacterium]|nr:hypothetical protein [Phycisphaerae bacterium]
MKRLSTSECMLAIWVCVLGAAVPLLTAAVRPNYKCSPTFISHCVEPYNCTVWGGYTCTDGSTSGSKKGQGVPFRVCVTSPGDNCSEESVRCFKDVYYKNTICTGDICAIYYYYTDGCE